MIIGGGVNIYPQERENLLVTHPKVADAAVFGVSLASAVTLACEMRFDRTLMDLQMPILDGLEATAAIRRFETGNSRLAVPVVANSNGSLRAGDLAAHGINGRLVKPCDDQDLEDCLVRWCPAYLSSSTVRGARHGNGLGQATGRNPGRVALRCAERGPAVRKAPLSVRQRTDRWAFDADRVFSRTSGMLHASPRRPRTSLSKGPIK